VDDAFVFRPARLVDALEVVDFATRDVVRRGFVSFAGLEEGSGA
jgi:hypothetical protein